MISLIDKARKDFDELRSIQENHMLLDDSEFQAFWQGYKAAVKRFGGRNEDRKSIRRELGYSRIGRNNV
jgi:hypothetical protein